MERPLNASAEDLGAEQAMSFWGKLGNIFASPGKAFTAIEKKPTWFWPFIIMMVISLLTSYLTMPQQAKLAVDNMMRQGNIPPEQMQMAMKTIPIGIFGTAFFMVIVWFFLFTAIYYLIGSVFLGGDSSFKKLLSVQAWSSFIIMVSSIIRVPLIRAKDSALVSLSPAMLLPSDLVGSKLFTMLSQIDFFIIWYLIVFGMGFSYIYRFSKVKSYTAIAICWIIWVAAITILSPSMA